MPESRQHAAVFARGPRFFDGAEGLMFELVLDSRSKLGPRPALDTDKAEHPEAWAKYVAGEVEIADPRAPVIQTTDHPEAKADHDAAKAEHQAAMDKKRRGGL